MMRNLSMYYFFLFFFIFVSQNVSNGSVLRDTGCSISVNTHLSDPQPLLLLKNGAVTDVDAFPLPVDKKGTLIFNKGETIDVACPGSTVVVGGSNTGKLEVEAKCESGITFTVQGKSTAFSSIKCTTDTFHTARYTGKKCASKYKEIEVGFKISNSRFIRHLTICFDDILQNSLYSQSFMTSTIGGFQVGYPRPDRFLYGSFYNVKPNSLDTLYSRKGQRKTINKILGLPESDVSVIHPTNDFFLAKGHYTAKADYVYGSQQRLTFWYVNVAPQWQICNGGNWNTMEDNSRKLASDRVMDLSIYTGSHGIATLPDIHGKEQDLYMWINGNDKGIPVPALFYKVLYEAQTKAGVVLLQVNNPYKKKIVSEDIICKDVCNKIKWLTWKQENITLGYSYCCEVDDFRRTVKVLPNFEVKSLLV